MVVVRLSGDKEKCVGVDCGLKCRKKAGMFRELGEGRARLFSVKDEAQLLRTPCRREVDADTAENTGQHETLDGRHETTTRQKPTREGSEGIDRPTR